jgi:hypothetical protein
MLWVYGQPYAVVVSVDEKSQIQALDRTPAGSSAETGEVRNPHARLQTTTLFAALSVLDGKVIGRCMPPTKSPGAGLARRASAMDVPLHANFLLLAQRRRRLLLQTHRQGLKRAVFRSVGDLESAITRYIHHQRETKPFVRNATAKIIQAELKLNRPSESVH